MKWYEWVFDGIGAQILAIIGGLIVCGGSGYLIGRWVSSKVKLKQYQKAKNNAVQNQMGNVNINNIEDIKDGNK